jgi:hypothetical protein
METQQEKAARLARLAAASERLQQALVGLAKAEKRAHAEASSATRDDRS